MRCPPLACPIGRSISCRRPPSRTWCIGSPRCPHRLLSDTQSVSSQLATCGAMAGVIVRSSQKQMGWMWLSGLASSGGCELNRVMICERTPPKRHLRALHFGRCGVGGSLPELRGPARRLFPAKHRTSNPIHTTTPHFQRTAIPRDPTLTSYQNIPRGRI